jgi:hypothetical protein
MSVFILFPPIQFNIYSLTSNNMNKVNIITELITIITVMSLGNAFFRGASVFSQKRGNCFQLSHVF